MSIKKVKSIYKPLTKRIHDFRRRYKNLSREIEATKIELEFLRNSRREVEKKYYFDNDDILFPKLSVWKIPKEEINATVSKKSRDRVLWSGLDKEQAFFTEVESLRRVNKNDFKLDGRHHFPRLVSVDNDGFSFEMEEVGISIKELDEKIRVEDIETQVDSIIKTLEFSKVVHLDMHEKGKNITIDSNGILYLIDFDIACLDEKMMSKKVELRYQKFIEEGGYSGQKERIINFVKSNKFILV